MDIDSPLILLFQPKREHRVLDYRWIGKDVYQVLVQKSFSQVLDIGWCAKVVSWKNLTRREVFLAIGYGLQKSDLFGSEIVNDIAEQQTELVNKRLKCRLYDSSIARFRGMQPWQLCELLDIIWMTFHQFGNERCIIPRDMFSRFIESSGYVFQEDCSSISWNPPRDRWNSYRQLSFHIQKVYPYHSLF